MLQPQGFAESLQQGVCKVNFQIWHSSNKMYIVLDYCD